MIKKISINRNNFNFKAIVVIVLNVCLLMAPVLRKKKSINENTIWAKQKKEQINRNMP